MEKTIVNKLCSLLRRLLENNQNLNSQTILSISKALIYLENIKEFIPKGRFFFSTQTKLVDNGNNETGATYKIEISKNGMNLSSSHYFSEAFGLSHDSHREVLWPEEYPTVENLNECFDSWEVSFFQGLADYKCIENLTGLNPKQLK